MKSRWLLGIALVCQFAGLARAGDTFTPDPLSVRRQGTGYRYPQNGWAVLHIEGEPYERGYQHGWLMAKEIETYIAALSEHRAAKSPTEYWDLYRDLVGGMYLHRFDREYLEEMKGIAEGATAAGAKAGGRPIDLIDIAGVNLWVELACLGDALRATPSPAETLHGGKPTPTLPPPAQEHHCSAFAATGPATADGKIVFGHITMWNIHQASHFFVWLDVKPAKGHRIVMQTFPGGIYSGMDYYISSSGLMLTETTLDQTRFNPEGIPLATRARRALQYADTIDGLVKELSDRNNGLYTNEWLIGDANTNEIAVFEQGTNAHRLRRSSKNEWLIPGVEGFYWGCNNAKDLHVRLDTVSSLETRPDDFSWRPSDRDLAWLKLYREHRGKIDVAFGKLAYSGPPLAKIRSLDAKITTSALAKDLNSYALCGPPYGRVWEPEPWQKKKYQIIRPLVPNDWAMVTPAAPAQTDRVAADLAGKAPATTQAHPPTAPAWHGTLLPKADADLWLTAGFAQCERLVALENALRERSGGNLTAADLEDLAVALSKQQSDYLSAQAARPGWRKNGAGVAPSPLDAELDRARWHREQVSYGALTLHALRSFAGSASFVSAMDAFGRANAGKEVSVRQFLVDFDRRTGKNATAWLTAWEKKPGISGPAFSAAHWLDEAESAVIVYGTAGDGAANREAAHALQDGVRVGYGNVVVPVKADVEMDDAKLRASHVILVGRPATNMVTKRLAASLPVTFGPGSMQVGDTHYAHEGTAVVAAGTNPFASRYSVILLAGLSADATFRLASRAEFPAAEVAVYFPDGKSRQMVVTRGDLLLGTAPASPVREKPGMPAKTVLSASGDQPKADANPSTTQQPLRTPERFLAIAEKLKATGKYEPKNGSTYCNFFARDFVKELLGHPLPELNGQANEQITKMTASPDWEKGVLVYQSNASGKNNLKGMTAKELQDQQDKGKLILYCWKHPEWSMEIPREQRLKMHGHIAVGMPLKSGDILALDEVWGTKENPFAVPMTAQSGSRVFPYGKLSRGFGAARKNDILIFIYKK